MFALYTHLKLIVNVLRVLTENSLWSNILIHAYTTSKDMVDVLNENWPLLYN